MIISATPYRISFFGGGTDYPVWFQEHGGAVLATTINNTATFAAHQSSSTVIVSFGRKEHANEVDDIVHLAVRVAIRYMNVAGSGDSSRWRLARTVGLGFQFLVFGRNSARIARARRENDPQKRARH